MDGYTPDGALESSRVETIEGQVFTIETVVVYEGSLSGLNVIPQGGDGVQGTWDPGVDYKMVTVSVTSAGRPFDPVVMETIVGPPSVGALEGVANGRVTLAAYEPFTAGTFMLPSLQIESAPASPISSGSNASVQIFPAVAPADYVVGLAVAGGWVIHPDDIVAGNDQLTISAGTTSDTSLRVYRPASLVLTVVDADTGDPVPVPRVGLTHVPTSDHTDYPVGVTTVTGLIPDAYDLTVEATGYTSFSVTSLNIPGGYPDPVHNLTVQLTSIGGTDPPVPVTVTVSDNTGRVVNGATVDIDDGVGGIVSGTTDISGIVTFDLVPGTTYTATASTLWGHGPTSVDFDPAVTTAFDLQLTRPAGQGTMVLRQGQNAEFGYRIGGVWVLMPSNIDGEASFVASAGWYRVAKRCISTGDVLGIRWVSVVANANRFANVSGFCP